MNSSLLKCAFVSCLVAYTVAFAQSGEAAKADKPTLEVVFVLDTTSSMTGLIEGAKEKIWSIASRMASGKPTPRIRVGLVAFRDRGDAYVTKRFDLTEDLDAVYANLQGLKAEGGGDGPEHVGQGLGEAVKLSSWSQDTKTAKMIFLVGDAPGHDDYKDEWNTKVWAKAAIAKGIVVNTIQCGAQADTGRDFRALSELADGSFIAIQQSGGMVAAKATPYDAELSKLNAELADTAIIAGKKESRVAGLIMNKGVKELKPETVSSRTSYKMAKGEAMGASLAGTGSFDVTAAPEKLAALKDEELPDELRALPKAERDAKVAKNAEARRALNTKLASTAKQRADWLAQDAKNEKASAKTASFDDEVFSSVKATAAKVGVKY